MIKIMGEPGSGKTRKIMERCFNEKAIFACKNPEAMEVKAHAYGFKDIEIISYNDFLINSNFNKNNVYLDDIEDFLKIIGCNVKGFGGNL